MFISYAHKDAEQLQALTTHLSALRREGWIAVWDDREIPAGADWADEIDARLNAADVILLLVSAHFIASDYCSGIELKRALQRHEDDKDRAVVIPVILDDCDWQYQPFAKFQALPRGAKGVNDWPTPAKYYTAVAQQLRERLRRLRDTDQSLVTRIGTRLRDPRWWQQPRVWGSALAMAMVLGVGLAAGLRWHHELTNELALATQAMRSGRYAQAAEQTEAACRGLSGYWPSCHVQRAKLQVMSDLQQPDSFNATRREALAERLQQRLHDAPDDPDWRYLDAALRLQTPDVARDSEQAGRAVQDIQTAIRQTGHQYPEAQFYLGVLYLGNGNHAEARKWLDAAVQGNRQSVPYRSARAYALMHLGLLKDAEADDRFCADSGFILSRLELAAMLWHGPADQPEEARLQEARAQLQEALRQLAGSPEPADQNAAPWQFDLGPADDPLTLTRPAEKRCMAELLLHSTEVLQGTATSLPPAAADCGVQAHALPQAVLHLLDIDGLPAPSRREVLQRLLAR